MKKTSFIVASLFLVQSAWAYQVNHTYRFTVLHTNDTHGRFWQNDKGEYGFSAHKTLIDKIKKEVQQQGGSVIILHAGDVNTGVPESDIQLARPDIEAMNKMGYEAMTLGNHEFDNPMQILAMQEKWAKFPFLSANTQFKKSGKHLVQPYTVLRKNGLKIAVVGLTTEETATAGNPLYIGAVQFGSVIPAARQTLAQVNAKYQPDVRIALTHLGYDTQNTATSDVKLAQGLPEKSFDAIIGGHSHTIVCVDESGKLRQDFQAGDACMPAKQNGTWIMQAGEWGKYLGRADFEFKNGETKLVNYQLIPVNLKNKEKQIIGTEIIADKSLMRFLQKYQDKAAEKLAEPVATLNGKFNGERQLSRSQPTALGHLITQAQKERVKADVAVLNGGAIRSSLPNGTISYKEILTVQPFGNIVSYVDLSGEQLLDYLQKVAQHAAGEGAYTHYSANLSFIYNRANKTLDNVRLDGKAIVPTQIYRLSLDNYLAAGGDGFPKVNGYPTYVETGLVDAEVLKSYLQQRQRVDVNEFAPKNEIVVQ